MSLCKCGCGMEVLPGNKYIHGHNRCGMASCSTNGKWSMKYDRCVECGTTERKHIGKGLCSKCHKKARYEFKKSKECIKWAIKYDKCIDCGRTDRPHHANGRCMTCHTNYLNRKKGKPERNFGGWSWYYDECKKCGTIKRPHAKDGLCVDCYAESKRDQNNLEVCPVCGVKVNKLNQHLAMKSRKCDKHRKYQYKCLKIYFDSDLNLSDISEELNMARHSITRQFIKYFGKEKTEKRNEFVRRCNISEKAVINKNYKNMYGTIVEYKSPNQGVVRLRSKLEAKYAKQLDKDKIDWYYEYRSFPYIDINGKRKTYTPDFYLPVENLFIEVKNKDLLNEEQLHKINWVNENSDVSVVIKIIK